MWLFNNITISKKMLLESNNIEQIEKYLRGDLGAAELDAFEQKLKSDNILAKETAEMETLVKTVRYGGQKDLENTIQQVQSKLQKEGFFDSQGAVIKPLGSKSRSLRTWWAAAAAVIILVGASMFLIQKNALPDTQFALEIFENQQPAETDFMYDDLEAFGLADENRQRKDELLDIIIVSKEESDFENLKKLYSQHIATYPNDHIAQLLFGEAFLNENLPEEAIKHLKPLSIENDFKYQNLAKWRLAQAHLTVGKKEHIQAAKALLIELQQAGDADYTKLASDVLETI